MLITKLLMVSMDTIEMNGKSHQSKLKLNSVLNRILLTHQFSFHQFPPINLPLGAIGNTIQAHEDCLGLGQLSHLSKSLSSHTQWKSFNAQDKCIPYSKYFRLSFELGNK